LWSPENPYLYGLQITTTHGGVTNDSVASYFGMRKISIQMVNGVPQIYLNNQSYFQMGPLDQGFWPDGIYTAPTDTALEYDLQMEKALGFNAVRKHIKVERQRWYYWADTLGLVVWQDMPSCNSYTGNSSPPPVDPLDFIAELTAMVTNHWNSPCIVMWDIFNEGQGEAGSGNGVNQTNTAYLVNLVKTVDPSRLVNQASGGSYFGVGDVLDSHSYPDPGDPTSSTQAPHGALVERRRSGNRLSAREFARQFCLALRRLYQRSRRLQNFGQRRAECRHLHPDHRRGKRVQRPDEL
jgi:beta-galactosidase/beta-glucuronidase